MALTREEVGRYLQGGAALGSAGAGFYNSSKNPADVANQTVGQIPGEVNPYYQPYINEGVNQLGRTSGEYTGLMNDPSGKLNSIGQGYQQSPGFKFALEQALKGSGNAAAAGGMAGSPQHEQENMGIASGLASKDYGEWLDRALGLYGEGLHGGQKVSEQGQTAGKNYADTVAQTRAQQAQLQYEGEAAKNKSNPWLNAFEGISKAIPFFL